jgi:TorA maturation chaperone TorD
MESDASRLAAAAAICNLMAESLTGNRQVIYDAMSSLKRIFAVLGMSQEYMLADEIATLVESDESAASEYVRLFEMGVAPTCETSYTCAGNPELKTYEMADIAGFYRAFSLKQAYGTPDDIRAELEFMALLFVKELIAVRDSDSESAEVCRDARRKFYGEHLSRWVENLADRVVENSSKPLYTRLTKLLKMVVLNGELMG